VPRWLVYSVLAIALFGVWGLVLAAASAALPPLTLQVFTTIGLVPVALLLAFSPNLRRGERVGRGCAYAFLTGLCGSLGNVALSAAFRRGGEASVVSPLTGMYPLVTLVLARLVLGEKLNRIQGLGIFLALAALFLFGDPDFTPGARLVAPWMAFALAALALWGILGVTQKLATRDISNELSTICFALASIPVSAVIRVVAPPDWNVPARAWVLGIGVGALLGIGTLVLFAAYRWGKATVVTALSGLYPALTAVLAVPVFGEGFGWKKGAAVALAAAASLALTWDRPGKSDP
jgi:drug/metabolite transporter (DMT)-like permease